MNSKKGAAWIKTQRTQTYVILGQAVPDVASRSIAHSFGYGRARKKCLADKPNVQSVRDLAARCFWRRCSPNSIAKKEKCRHGVIPRSLHLLFLLVEIVSLLEFVDASTGVNKFLFAREVRMALGANFNTKFVDVLGGTGLECVSACTHDCYVMVLGMDSFFHFDSPDSFFYTHTRQYVTRIWYKVSLLYLRWA